MPALNYDYDYYEYARRKTSAAKATPSASRAPRRTTTASTTNRTTNRVATKNSSTTASRVASRPTTRVSRTAPKPVTRTTTTKKANRGIDVDVNIKSRATRALATKPQEMTLKKPKVSKKAKKQVSFKTILKVSVLFVAFFAICYRYSIINEKFLDIKKIQSELEVNKTVNEQLQSDIENNTDLKYVESYAKYQLGMQKPSTSQIQYINIEKQDKIIAPVSIEEESDEGILNTIVNAIGGFLGK